MFEERDGIYGAKRFNSCRSIEPQIEYNKAISKGKVGLLIGGTYQQNSNSWGSAAGFGHNSDLVLEDINTAARLFL